MIIEDPEGLGGNARVLAKRLQTDATTRLEETNAAINGTKNTILTSKIPVTNAAASDIFILQYTGTGTLIIANNALVLFNQVGTATDTGTITIKANGEEGGGSTFTDVSLQNSYFNWNIGNTRTVNFTAKQGVDGDTVTGATQTLDGPFASISGGTANSDPFAMIPGATYSLGVTLPTGITSADAVVVARVYEI